MCLEGIIGPPLPSCSPQLCRLCKMVFTNPPERPPNCSTPECPNSKIMATTNKWPRCWEFGIIPYVIESSLDHIRDRIKIAMNQFHRNTFITFLERKDEKDYILFTDQPPPNMPSGCYSHVGKIGGEQKISLGTGCEDVATIVHELMHTVGFFHEHSRPDRDEYVEIIEEKIHPQFQYAFRKIPTEEIPIYGEFDYDSVMHYGNHAFSIDQQPTIIAKKNNVILRAPYMKYGLNANDVQKIKNMYKYEWRKPFNMFNSRMFDMNNNS